MFDLINNIIYNSSLPGSLYVATFLFGLISGLHCIVMCGPMMNECSSCKRGINYSFHGGRLLTYFLLALTFGHLGEFMFSHISQWLSQFAVTLLTLLVILSLFALLAQYKDRAYKGILRPWFQALFRLHSKIQKLPSRYRSFATGFLSSLLPCGALYMILALAISVGSTEEALLIVILFWCGTLPLLEFSHKAIQALSPQRLRFLQLALWISCLLVIQFRSDISFQKTLDAQSQCSLVKGDSP